MAETKKKQTQNIAIIDYYWLKLTDFVRNCWIADYFNYFITNPVWNTQIAPLMKPPIPTSSGPTNEHTIDFRIKRKSRMRINAPPTVSDLPDPPQEKSREYLPAFQPVPAFSLESLFLLFLLSGNRNTVKNIFGLDCCF